MTDAPTPSLRERNRQLARDVVLDAAERLLQSGGAADFSMRALAAEAGVGFATPFNHFGSKTAIMQALSARLIQRMADAFRAEAPAGDAVDRVLAMTRIAAALLLERPEVYKAVVGSLGVPAAAPSAVMPNSQALWALALADMDGLESPRDAAREDLARHLAFGFRGCVSFWIAGDVADDAFGKTARAHAAICLLGFVAPARRAALLASL